MSLRKTAAGGGVNNETPHGADAATPAATEAKASGAEPIARTDGSNNAPSIHHSIDINAGTTTKSSSSSGYENEKHIAATEAPDAANKVNPAKQPEGVPGKEADIEQTVEADADLESEEDPEIAGIPLAVRRVVSLHDDPSLPTITFRYFLLSVIFVVPGAFLSILSQFRTTSAPYSVFFVQIVSNYAGLWLARVLPAWDVRIPFTQWSFNLNPGPWSVKEHVLVTITAASGASGNGAAIPISVADLYFNERLHPAAAIFFMFSVDATGYAFAAIGRQILLYEPAYPWFQALCQAALFETQRKGAHHETKAARKQMRVFFLVLLGITLWQFLPEYVFPMLGSLAFLCWVAPHNPVANFVGSGLGGMGFLNFSMDWANVSNGPPLFLSPWWTQVVFFASYVLVAWVLIPAAKWGNLGSYKQCLMTNRACTEDGSRYPLASLLTPQHTLNQTAYEENGPIFLGTQSLFNMFFDYCAYISSYTWIALFGAPQIIAAYRKFRERVTEKGSGVGINHQYTDRLNVLMRAYKEVPLWWYAALFVLFCFIPVITMTSLNILYIPVWTYFVALGTGALVIIPLGWLFAVSNYQLPIGTFNELLYGVMVQNLSDHRSPVGASMYGAIAGGAWYRAQYMLQDQKIGHYTHTPPRAVFFSQIFGIAIGVPINYAALRWIIDAKRDYLTGDLIDPAHIWTGQTAAGYLTLGVQYVVIGPTRLFQQAIFRPLPYAFLVGASVPVIIYALHRAFPRAKFNLWNATIFFSGASTFYGNVSTGQLSRLIGAWVVMYWAYRYRYALWSRWNYILAAAFDTGFNLNMLLIFLFFGSGKVVSMPNWWGNDGQNVEKCYALD